MISLDCETSGVDFYHGARPYFVTICQEDGTQKWWCWDVDPITREPEIPQADKEEIRTLIHREGSWQTWDEKTIEQHSIIGQNIKFDVAALVSIGIDCWPWSLTHDTLSAGHLLASNQPHDLTSMAYQYLGRVGKEMEGLERSLEEACKEARRVVQQAKLRAKRGSHPKKKVKAKANRGLFGSTALLPSVLVEEDEDNPLTEWRIAEAGLEDMPSAKEKSWKIDGWLPRALAAWARRTDDRELCQRAEKGKWETVLRDYSNSDSAVTLALWQVMKRLLKERDLWEIYLESRKLLPVVHGMERRGTTYLDESAAEVRKEYETKITTTKSTCVQIAKARNYDLEMPKGSVNGSLRTFCFDVLDLPRIRNPKAKTAAPSMDAKNAFPVWLETLPEGSDQLKFVKALSDYRDLGTGLSFLDAYERFKVRCPTLRGISVLHGNLNPTGTDTLRFTMNNPNLQQVSKKKKTNQRRCFGPAPSREWWALDYENLELRIPTFEANEPELVEVFLHPERPPFFGSYHMVVFAALWPELWTEDLLKCGEEGAATYCKDKYGDGPYQWTKNFDFGVIYGCMEATGDRTAHKKGAWQANRQRFPKIAALSDRWIDFAEKKGYVETIPDKTVNPQRGYPLLCSRTDWGKISPTVPLNYHVSGTAMWCTRKAMVRCQNQLDEWNKKGNVQYHLALQVHDEMVFDFPAGGRKNLPKVLRLKALMEQSGEDINVPLTVSCSWHPKNWAEKKKW